MIHPEDRAKVHKVVTEAVEGHSQYHLDFRLIRPDGQLRYLHGEGEVVRNDAGRAVRTVGFLQDVTELHLGKIAMENANRSLEAKNIALGEILANIETERDKIGQRVNKNVEEIVLPLLHTLGHGATHQQERVIEQIENCLEEITSPFLDKVARAVKNLTPTELRVCNYIRRGLTVKQIADLEHLSPETISAHRRNIRRKLHIANRKINLATYLRHVYHDPPAESN
jgi:DNA-binding CsgD family transcriptional regulator